VTSSKFNIHATGESLPTDQPPNPDTRGLLSSDTVHFGIVGPLCSQYLATSVVELSNCPRDYISKGCQRQNGSQVGSEAFFSTLQRARSSTIANACCNDVSYCFTFSLFARRVSADPIIFV